MNRLSAQPCRRRRMQGRAGACPWFPDGVAIKLKHALRDAQNN